MEQKYSLSSLKLTIAIQSLHFAEILGDFHYLRALSVPDDVQFVKRLALDKTDDLAWPSDSHLVANCQEL